MLRWCCGCLKEITSHQLKADNERRKVSKKAESIYELVHIANQAGMQNKTDGPTRRDQRAENEKKVISDLTFFWLHMASCCCSGSVLTH